MDKTIRLVDRSRTVTDWVCGRKRYLNYELDGRGIVSSGLALELYLGTVIHDSLAAIAHGVDIYEICTAAVKQVLDALMPQVAGEIDGEEYAKEQAALVEGLVRGYFRVVWPKLQTMYPTIIAIEQEMEFKISDSLTFMAKPDLIMADSEGNWHYIEFKSTSSKKDEWINSWSTAVQLHSAIKAVEETLGTAPVDVTVIGIYKGYRSYSKQNSPMCYCYMRSGSPPFSQDQVLYEYKAGFKRTPTWNMEGGVKKWVEGMPEELLVGQYPMTPPIFVKEDLVNRFFAQLQVREKEIELALQLMKDADDDTKEAILDCAFRQYFDACSPAWGHPCSYKKICFGHVSNPLEEGFELRVAHHAGEAKQQLEKENEQA